MSYNANSYTLGKFLFSIVCRSNPAFCKQVLGFYKQIIKKTPAATGVFFGEFVLLLYFAL